MEIAIDVIGFDLGDDLRDRVWQRAVAALERFDVTRFELALEWKQLVTSDEVEIGYGAFGRAVLADGDAIACAGEARTVELACQALIDEIAAVARRTQELGEHLVPCPRCGAERFALITAWTGMPNVDALVCKTCGRVEQFMRDLRPLRQSVEVRSRAKPPYR